MTKSTGKWFRRVFSSNQDCVCKQMNSEKRVVKSWLVESDSLRECKKASDQKIWEIIAFSNKKDLSLKLLQSRHLRHTDGCSQIPRLIRGDLSIPHHHWQVHLKLHGGIYRFP